MSTTTAATATPNKVITGIVRFSYLHVWEPTSINPGDDPKYSVSLLIPKSDKATIAAIKEAIKVATEQGKTTKFEGKIPGNLKQPLRDGDVERPDDENYAGHMFINANCKTKPGIVDKNSKPIMDQDEVYSGCYGRASITFYAFNAKGSKGIACGLNHIMKTKDGEPLGARSTAESDFAGIADADEDFG
jgi:hypothetical protein